MAYVDPDAILAELDKDDRIGPNMMVVQKAETKVWDNQDKTYKLRLSFEGKGGTVFLDIPDKMYTDAEFKAESPNWDDKKKKGVKLSAHIRKALKEHYGVPEPEVIKEGFRFAAKIGRWKDGYLHVEAVLPISALKKEASPDPSIPF